MTFVSTQQLINGPGRIQIQIQIQIPYSRQKKKNELS